MTKPRENLKSSCQGNMSFFLWEIALRWSSGITWYGSSYSSMDRRDRKNPGHSYLFFPISACCISRTFYTCPWKLKTRSEKLVQFRLSKWLPISIQQPFPLFIIFSFFLTFIDFFVDFKSCILIWIFSPSHCFCPLSLQPPPTKPKSNLKEKPNQTNKIKQKQTNKKIKEKVKEFYHEICSVARWVTQCIL